MVTLDTDVNVAFSAPAALMGEFDTAAARMRMTREAALIEAMQMWRSSVGKVIADRDKSVLKQEAK